MSKSGLEQRDSGVARIAGAGAAVDDDRRPHSAVEKRKRLPL
jgi:hypothetical protein